jgi:hypothetical protein
MPIVPNLADTGPYAMDNVGAHGTDRKLASPNRKNAGTPYGSLTPQYSGEMVLDTVNQQLYVGGASTDNTAWTPVFRGL